MAVNLLDRFENYKIFSLQNRNIYFKSLRRKNFTVPNSAIKNGFTDEEFFNALKELIITHFDMDTNEIIRYKGGLDSMLDPIQRDILWALYNQMDYMIGNGTWKLIDGNLSISLGGNSIQTSSNSLGFNWHDDSWNILRNYKLVDQYGTGQLKWTWNNGWCQYDIDKEIVATKQYVDNQIELEENARKNADIQLQNNINQETEDRINANNLKLDKKDQFFSQFQQTDDNGNPIGNVIDIGFINKTIYQGLTPPPYDPNTKTQTIQFIKEVPTTGAPISTLPIPAPEGNSSAISASWAYNENELIKTMQATIDDLQKKINEMLWEVVDTSDFVVDSLKYEFVFNQNYYYRIYASTNTAMGIVLIEPNFDFLNGLSCQSVFEITNNLNYILSVSIADYGKEKLQVNIFNRMSTTPFVKIRSLYMEKINKNGYLKQNSLKRIKREEYNFINEEQIIKDNEIIGYNVVKKMIEGADDIYEMIQIEKHPLYKKELENKNDIKSIFNKKWLELNKNG